MTFVDLLDHKGDLSTFVIIGGYIPVLVGKKSGDEEQHGVVDKQNHKERCTRSSLVVASPIGRKVWHDDLLQHWRGLDKPNGHDDLEGSQERWTEREREYF
jgi:hypothetical protein